ncbi:MAG: cupin domain-containing protein [Cyanobacteria bacterium]|nr:cupin domain-containing protein [Cyanobacteria bacterium CG_2015-16_32_12]NCO77910.1 cupin domain-containing protein [Cyanobacteria bacterium CG_2015-22_32_23]NCQ04465.1 cupin domain-containing protein [Cyanobacteria bacterium CG_2015-09_32_10]NCQ43066.1 cupin domain-containing protein [Cyanobacteria bacterium CG_2015-04_32_10]NCS85577.1 cupin domain-containing protein [Cyanobacteria bacterium CG_2015-02_32_10]
MKYISLNKLPIKSVSHNVNIKKKTILKKGNIPHLTNFSQAVFTSGQIANIHSHNDMWEVFFVQSGSGIIKVNGSEYLLVKDVCVMVEPKESHEIINNGKDDLIINYFGII